MALPWLPRPPSGRGLAPLAGETCGPRRWMCSFTRISGSRKGSPHSGCALLCLGSFVTRPSLCPAGGVGGRHWQVSIYLGRREINLWTWHILAWGPRPKQGSLEVAVGGSMVLGVAGCPHRQGRCRLGLGPQVQTEEMDKGCVSRQRLQVGGEGWLTRQSFSSRKITALPLG